MEEYDIQFAEDIQDALKDLLGGTIKKMMETEMDVVTKNLNAQIMMIIATVISGNRSTADTARWKSKCRGIAN